MRGNITKVEPECANMKKEEVSHVNEQLERVFNSLGIVNTTIDRLHSKLSSVIDDRPTVENIKGDEKKDDYLVPLASDIREINRQINSQNDRLRYIIDRLEL